MRTTVTVLCCVFAVGCVAWGQDAPMKVLEATAKQAAVEKVVPEYPAMARQLKLVGRVEVEATVDVEGKVENAKIVSGNPVLGTAAVNAMKRWKFTPFVADGKTTRALTTITFEFKL